MIGFFRIAIVELHNGGSWLQKKIKLCVETHFKMTSTDHTFTLDILSMTSIIWIHYVIILIHVFK